MMPLKTTLFDPAELLTNRKRIEAYLEAAFETGDQAFISDALGVVARARGMSQLATETGLTRQTLYKALSAEGNPEFSTIIKVAGALGFRLKPELIDAAG